MSTNLIIALIAICLFFSALLSGSETAITYVPREKIHQLSDSKRNNKIKIYVNGKNLDDYFTRATHKMQILRPFEIINQSTEYDVRSQVVGGGHTGQAGALVHGISRALLQFDENLKPTLRKEKLTTRDSRSVERKKPGRAKARRSYQFSKR